MSIHKKCDILRQAFRKVRFSQESNIELSCFVIKTKKNGGLDATNNFAYFAQRVAESLSFCRIL